MPSIVTPRRRRRDDGSDDSDGNVSSVASEAASHSSKRVRREKGATAPSSLIPLPNGNILQSNDRPTNGARKVSMKHQPGSIVRVKLENFVTYTFVEIFPGPSLNMVIGPNGTGKSTLVCAICLGLGWGSQHLGRAKEVSEFVKHGASEASIEIELCADGTRMSKNPVIRCNIKREGNKCNYYVDGKPESKKKVMNLARKFSIQIDNLCQFLPQDKVVEFAAMTPVDLLRSTQRAVASQEMIDWHDQLKEMRGNQRAIEHQQVTDRDSVTNLEARQRMQEADVSRIRERDQVLEKVRLLQAALPIVEYRDANTKFKAAKDQRISATTELDELKKRVAPALRDVTAKQPYRDEVRAALDHRIAVLEQAEARSDNQAKKIETFQDKANQVRKEMDTELNSIKTNRTEIKRLEGVIGNLKRQMQQAPSDFDVAASNEKTRERQRSIRELEEERTQMIQNLKAMEAQGRERVARISEAEQEEKNFESQAGQQAIKLSRINNDAYKAWRWIQQHQEEFEKPVFGPPIVECSVKDAKYVQVVEALLQMGDLTTLTVQTRSDFNKLHEILHEQQRLIRLNIREVSFGLDRFPSPPVSKDDMSRFGLDGWALDFLSGPEPVLAMLCDAAKIHQNAVSVKKTTDAQFDMIKESPIVNWATPVSMYRITRRREYGPGAESILVRGTRAPQIWTDQPVDMAAKRDLREKIDQWTQENQELRGRFEHSKAKIVQLKDQRVALEQEMDEFRIEKEAKQKALTNFNALPTRLAQQEEKRDAARALIDGVRARHTILQNKYDSHVLEKGQAALDFASMVEALRVAYNQVQEAEIMHIEASSDLEVLSARNSDVKQQLDDKRREIERLEADVRAAKDRAKTALRVAQEMKAEADDAVNKFLEEESERLNTLSIEQLEGEIDSEKARLELMHGGDGHVIVQYEKREREIERLRLKLQTIDTGLAEVTAKIASVRNSWEPRLDALVARISRSFNHNMQQIGCAGEVGVHKDEEGEDGGSDFDQWAIRIMVKFRDHEPLAQLDSHRQSGGERAVSTVFYLMSLQSLARSPFRVVDEINQGMDPRNERLVHARMVAIATGNDEWQRQYDDEEAATIAAATNTTGGGAGKNRRKRNSGSGNGDEEDEEEDDDEGDDNEEADMLHRPTSTQGSQYFLITPKLLHDLRYEPGMRVLCIASGEYMPGDQTSISFKHSLEIRRRLAGSAPVPATATATATVGGPR